MKVQILLFGRLTELLGQTHLELEEVADTDAVTLRLGQQYPALQQLKYQVAVDQTLIQGNQPLSDGMTVALMPPFSGG